VNRSSEHWSGFNQWQTVQKPRFQRSNAAVALGLTGHALDLAIANNLPRRLAQMLDGTVYH
jgi:hypothetical protein